MNIERPTLHLLNGFDPNPDRLVDLLRTRVDNNMLVEIASADYGWRAQEYHPTLEEIRATGKVPSGRFPGEVLELVRWSVPEDPAWKPGLTGEPGHIARAFCCALLLREGYDPAGGENQTVAKLLDSAFILGLDVQRASASLLAWRVQRLGPYSEKPFFAFALLVLALEFGEPDFKPAFIAELADWLIQEERSERDQDASIAGKGFLLGITFHNICHDLWRGHARRMQSKAQVLKDVNLREKLLNLCEQISAAG